MEETQNTEQKSNYIELSQDSQGVGNIFNELSGELGELNFSEKNTQEETRKKDPIEIAYLVSKNVFIFGIIITILLSLDVFIRSSEDNQLFASLPICSYLSLGTDGYDNVECKTIPMISTEVHAEKEKLEKNIASNLIILVPKFMQSLDITNSPKVQFIQEHTGDSRVSITDAMARFTEIKNRTSYQGEDIECKTISIDETGKISASCQTYGGSLVAPSGLSTKTSRETALSFLERLDDTKNGFQILSYPKTLDISEFNSTDGFKAIFSTKTSLELKLQYLSANKM
ncbi:MAG: hypothetical protein PHH16_00250 [Candidatus Gracilibacteria bacterium]|nr:hypothetical protein [Candidatus Gracilibacteria bacterium]